MKKLLLLDIENISQTENELIDNLFKYHRVYLVYAKSCIKVNLDGLVGLAPFLMKGKLKILKMSKIGKNAADIGLAFIAGRLSKKKKKYEFHIMSNDHSMGYVAELLNALGNKAIIINNKQLSDSVVKDTVIDVSPVDGKVLHIQAVGSKKKEQISQKVARKMEVGPDDVFEKFCTYLVQGKIPKPSSEVSLLNNLKSMSRNGDYSNHVFKLLKEKGIVRIENKKVMYNDAKMRKCIEWETI